MSRILDNLRLDERNGRKSEGNESWAVREQILSKMNKSGPMGSTRDPILARFSSHRWFFPSLLAGAPKAARLLDDAALLRDPARLLPGPGRDGRRAVQRAALGRLHLPQRSPRLTPRFASFGPVRVNSIPKATLST